MYARWASNWRVEQRKAQQAIRRLNRLPSFIREAELREAAEVQQHREIEAARLAVEREQQLQREQELENQKRRIIEAAKRKAKDAKRKVFEEYSFKLPTFALFSHCYFSVKIHYFCRIMSMNHYYGEKEDVFRFFLYINDSFLK